MMEVNENYMFQAPNGIWYGFWVLCRYSGKYTGSYPPAFLKRVKAVLGEGKYLHICSGSVKDGDTVDISPEMHPTFLCNAEQLPISDNIYDVVIADPPYAKNVGSAKGRKFPSLKKLIQEGVRVTKIGGYFGLLHWIVPARPKNCKLYGGVAVFTGPNKRIRAFTIFQKIDDISNIQQRKSGKRK